MTNSKQNVTNANLYDRLDSLRLEVKQDINVAVNTVSISQGRLEKKFDDLEAGRLTRAEGNINDLRIQLLEAINTIKVLSSDTKNTEKTFTNKFLALSAIGMLLLSGFIYALFQWIFTGITR